ncbi:alpha-1,3-mannosyl-glycoprotein 4-beta-N-acetylglucosaminyltransferase A [Patella vulgata]|uniref:alpha-1,3-mannosyl-glycoprotein 4-beta-N-acetylglucosaminyltransferase A n=1 Tax=Patella vulgata TaxID=6465 RepID=UPI00217FA674|nr:alpha-1,3-mannosyl-glycoprotein 4-beta-N-acetylglucosaminyltransferase A [Patella vulgata]
MRMRFRLRNVLIVTLVVCFTPLLWLSVFSNNGTSPYEEAMQKRFADLRDRLQFAESLNRQRENDLFILRKQFNYLVDQVGSNRTSNSSAVQRVPNIQQYLNNFTGLSSQDGLFLPGILAYLPHLSGHPEFTRPRYKLSEGSRNQVSVVFGIPTIKRSSISYLSKTLHSLVDGLDQTEKADCLIVVFIAEPWDEKYVEEEGKRLKSEFPEEIKSGLIEVIAPPAGFYPNLNNLKESFGDDKQRVKWRTKQNLDFSFLMLYAKSRGVYYVQLEDDVISKSGYLSIIKSFTYQQKDNTWLLLEFSTLGFIGKLFRSADLPTVVEFFLMFYSDKPIDWLLDHLITVKVCNPEKNQAHCSRMKLGMRKRFKPSLFQHIGLKSSLDGKIQKLKDRAFGKNGLYRAHINPPAKLATSLKTYQTYTLAKAYVGETFFWSIAPTEGDIIDIILSPPIYLDKILFRTGSETHLDDRLRDASVQIQFEDEFDGRVDSSLPIKAGDRVPAQGFTIIALFDKNGLGERTLPSSTGKIKTVRIHCHSNSDNWLVVSEIMIKPREVVKV